MFRNDATVPGSIASHAFRPAQSQFGLAQHIVAPPPSIIQQQQAEIAAKAHREATAGEFLFQKGDYRSAVTHFTEAVRLRPTEPTYRIYLACANWRAGNLDRVESQFNSALAIQPNNAGVHEMMASFFVEQGELTKALTHSTTAMTIDPATVSYKVTHADVLCAQGQVEAVWEIIKPLIAAGTGGQWLARVLAKVAARVGHVPEALSTIDRELSNPNISMIDRARLHYAAANLLDGIGQYDAAFEHARRANECNQHPFDPVAHSRFVSNQIAYYNKTQIGSLPRATHGSRRPVLVVGVTRSGSSLVEQILASHPKVFGAGELSYLSEAAFAANTSEWSRGEEFPKVWNHLSVSRANELASSYLSRIGALNSTATYVTDKMPENFLFLGTAQLLLPNCRIIHCIRDPRDTCLSCYFTDFASGKNFSSNLSHLASYYRDYARLMVHWKSVLNLPILDVRYEDLVSDQVGQTKRMLDFLDLPWDENCQNYHKNTRHVATASRDQVRRPVYSSSIGRWKHYEKHIPELMGLVQS